MNMYIDKCEMSLSTLSLPEYYRILKSFDDFLTKINYTGGDITIDIINEWTISLQPRKNKNLYIKAVLPMAIRIMDCCGTRETETLMLQMKDIDFKNGTLTLRNTKRDKERMVPITKSLMDILNAYCLAMGIFSTPDAYLFPGLTKDKPLSSDTFSHLIPRILSKANVERNQEKRYSHSTSAHCFRHSFACRSLEHMIDSGFDEADRFPYLSTYLGHENLNSTQKYLQYPTDRMDSDVEKFETYGEDIFNSIPVMQEDISTWTK